MTYYLKVATEKVAEAKQAFASYLTECPAAQSVIGCIAILDKLELEETA